MADLNWMSLSNRYVRQKFLFLISSSARTESQKHLLEDIFYAKLVWHQQWGLALLRETMTFATAASLPRKKAIKTRAAFDNLTRDSTVALQCQHHSICGAVQPVYLINLNVYRVDKKRRVHSEIDVNTSSINFQNFYQLAAECGWQTL